ncbi:MAG: Type pilus pilin [Patescibacteria group bacterium]|nr:Type pilus pilin [Patescibacteria group bacterium]
MHHTDTVSSARKVQRGLTLIEMLVVIGLTGLVGVGLLSMIAYFYRSNAFLLEATTAVDSASRGVRESLTLLRGASYGEDGTYPVAAAATSSVTFYSNADSDRAIERVRLYVLGGTLYQVVTNAGGNPPSYSGQTQSTSTIATWVSNATSTPAFRYYNNEGTELTGMVDITAVRTVRSRIDVDINPYRAPNILTIEGSATLRNLRDE